MTEETLISEQLLLQQYPDSTLLAEVKRRGFRVFRHTRVEELSLIRLTPLDLLPTGSRGEAYAANTWAAMTADLTRRLLGERLVVRTTTDFPITREDETQLPVGEPVRRFKAALCVVRPKASIIRVAPGEPE